MTKKSDQELIDEYFKSGKTITVYPCIEEVEKPYTGELQKANTPIEYDKHGKRIYRNLGKTMEIYPEDETKRYYGK